MGPISSENRERERLRSRLKRYLHSEKPSKGQKKADDKSAGNGAPQHAKANATDGGSQPKADTVGSSKPALHSGSQGAVINHSAASTGTTTPEALQPNHANSPPLQDLWPENLWDEAYRELRKTNKLVIATYQNYLLKWEASDAKVNDLGSSEGQSSLQELVTKKLDYIRETRLRIPVYAKRVYGEFVVKKVAVRDQVCNIIRGIQSVSGFISTTLSPMPPAALAWAGVLVILPVVLNTMTKDQDAMDGLEYISDLLVRCKLREDTIRRRLSSGSYHFLSCQRTWSEVKNVQELITSLKRKTVQLYTGVLKYQIQLAIHYNHGLFRRSLGDFVVSNDWKGMVADLDNASRKINEDLSEQDRQAMTNEFANLREKADQELSILKNVQDSIEGAAQDSLLKELPRAIFAAFDSYETPGETTSLYRTCLEGTQVEALNLIYGWSDRPVDYKCVFWLKGMPGTGKSTIARTVASTFSAQGRLGGSFFFSKRRAELTNAAQLFTTLASQLTEVLPDIKRYVTSAIKEKKDIGGKGLTQQWEQLIFLPLSKLDDKLYKGLYPSFALVFVIDALDECEADQDLREILPLLGQLKSLKIIQLRVLVTSRPENLLRGRFTTIPDAVHHDEELHKVAAVRNGQDDGDDITKLFEHEMDILRKEIPLQGDWPGKDNMKRLASKADGLFIYAATACRFLRAATSERSANIRLNTIYDDEATTNSPQQNLDNIYAHILKFSVADKIERERAELLQLFRHIVGSIVILFDPLSANSLSKLLYIPRKDIDDTLRDLHSLLAIPKDMNEPIQSLHLSFPEFLVDDSRCPADFSVDGRITNRNLAERCLQSMSEFLSRDICGLKTPGTLKKQIEPSAVQRCIPDHVQYACRYWINHLLESDIENFDNMQVVQFLREHFLHWLEALSLLGKVSEGVQMIRELSKQALFSSIDSLRSILKDAERFILNFKPILEVAPLQVYNSAILFSPRSSIIKQIFITQAPSWVKRMPEVTRDWSACLQFFECDTLSPVIAFSPDNQLLVSVSKQQQLDLWDPKTGASRGNLNIGSLSDVICLEFSPDNRLLVCSAWQKNVFVWDAETWDRHEIKGHLKRVHALAFSPDSQILATASDDHTVRLWDPRTGKCRAIFTGHSKAVRSLAYAPDGRFLASASYGENVRIWDPRTGKPGRVLEGHTDMVLALDFSPDGECLASGSDDGTVRLWHPSTGNSRTLKGHSAGVSAVRFSPNGQLLASGYRDGRIVLWNPVQGVSLCSVQGHSNVVFDIVFAPEGSLFASAAGDNAVKLWNSTQKRLHASLEDHADCVYHVRFSQDGNLLASASGDGTVRVWDPKLPPMENSFERHSVAVWAVMFSPDGKFLASIAHDSMIKLWNPSTGALWNARTGQEGMNTCLLFSPDGQILASAAEDTISLWDLTAETFIRLTGHKGWVTTLAFSPSGRLLASAAGQTIKRWDGRTFSHVYTETETWLTKRNVWVWDTKTGEERCVFDCDLYESRPYKLEALKFSADEQTLAGRSGGKIWLWNLETKQLVKFINIHRIDTEEDSEEDSGKDPEDTLDRSEPGDEKDREMIAEIFTGLLDEPKAQHLPDLYVKNHWVTFKKDRVLWLPPDYRATCIAVRDNLLAMGHGSGRVTFIDFDLDAIPYSDLNSFNTAEPDSEVEHMGSIDVGS